MSTTEQITSALKQASSRIDGREILEGLSKQQLREVANDLEATYYANDTKAQLAHRIIENAIGARVDAAAIRSTTWKR